MTNGQKLPNCLFLTTNHLTSSSGLTQAVLFLSIIALCERLMKMKDILGIDLNQRKKPCAIKLKF